MLGADSRRVAGGGWVGHLAVQTINIVPNVSLVVHNRYSLLPQIGKWNNISFYMNF